MNKQEAEQWCRDHIELLKNRSGQYVAIASGGIVAAGRTEADLRASLDHFDIDPDSIPIVCVDDILHPERVGEGDNIVRFAKRAVSALVFGGMVIGTFFATFISATEIVVPFWKLGQPGTGLLIGACVSGTVLAACVAGIKNAMAGLERWRNGEEL